MSEAADDTVILPDALRGWLAGAVASGASDLHLIAGYPPVQRLHGDLTETAGPALQAGEIDELLTAVCPPVILSRLHAQKNVDFSFEMTLADHNARFRANLFYCERFVRQISWHRPVQA